MEIADKINSYIPFYKNMLMLAFSVDDGWSVVNKGEGLFGEYADDIKTIYDVKRFVHNESIEAFSYYINMIQNATKGDISDIILDQNKISMPVLMKTNGMYKYCNAECYYDINNNKLSRVFVMISVMDAQESYRYKISKAFTSDRNPNLINQQAEQMIKENPGVKYAVIQFDIVKFKLIAEQYGNESSSMLLDYISNKLECICGSKQVFVRLTADVFMIVTPYESDDDILRLINTLDDSLLGYNNMNYSFVYGVCYVEDISKGLRKYGDAAAMTRQSLKGNALKHIGFYNAEILSSLSGDKYIEDRMDVALSDGQFKMFLQPKFEIETKKLVGAEALVRWDDPEKGILPPIVFLPLFERNGFILKMDEYIWEQACIKIRDWIDRGIEPIPISVNVSRKHLFSSSFISKLDELIDKYNIPKKYIEIEITESIESDNALYKYVNLIREDGFKILMDDFGAGYSSLNTLKDTKFDVIKIDRLFLNNFTDNERGKKVVKYTIMMSKEIGLELIAEGVETKEQAEFLRDCGCLVAQGFFYDKPLPIDEFEGKYINIEQ